MSETEFWGHLEYRVCRELEGLRDRTFRGWWCDGFVAESLDESRSAVVGRVWICQGRHQDEWALTLSLGRTVESMHEILWDALLPAENVTGWLHIDRDRKCVTINPQAAYADLES